MCSFTTLSLTAEHVSVRHLLNLKMLSKDAMSIFISSGIQLPQCDDNKEEFEVETAIISATQQKWQASCAALTQDVTKQISLLLTYF